MWKTLWPASRFVLKTVRYPRSLYPCSFAITAARRNIEPTSASCSGARSFSEAICNFGMSSTCSGACGLMSEMAMRSGSSNTGFTGISRAIILQKRQSRMHPPAADDRARYILQIVANLHNVEPIHAAHEVGHAVILSAAEFHDEVAARHKLRDRPFEHTAQSVQSVLSA